MSDWADEAARSIVPCEHPSECGWCVRDQERIAGLIRDAYHRGCQQGSDNRQRQTERERDEALEALKLAGEKEAPMRMRLARQRRELELLNRTMTRERRRNSKAESAAYKRGRLDADSVEDIARIGRREA